MPTARRRIEEIPSGCTPGKPRLERLTALVQGAGGAPALPSGPPAFGDAQPRDPASPLGDRFQLIFINMDVRSKSRLLVLSGQTVHKLMLSAGIR